jgi:hypothetical protein
MALCVTAVFSLPTGQLLFKRTAFTYKIRAAIIWQRVTERDCIPDLRYRLSSLKKQIEKKNMKQSPTSSHLNRLRPFFTLSGDVFR